MLTFFALLFVGCAAYRVGRFIALDTLIEEPRDRFFYWLANKDGLVWEKISTLLQCPYCITIWTSFFGTLYWYTLVWDWPGWAFPVYWLTAATVAIIIWTYVDSED